MSLAIVVPTRNRPAELAGLLANLIGQTRRPDRIVVVDSSDGGLAGEIRAIVAASPLTVGKVEVRRSQPVIEALPRRRSQPILAELLELENTSASTQPMSPTAIADVIRAYS